MTSLPWFRLYHRIIDDKKLKLLAFEDRWHFVALCCLKASGELDEPDFTLRCRQVAVALGLAAAELDEVARRLQAVKLIDQELCPISWDKLQFRSDKDETAAERQRRKRRKDKGLPPVTGVSRVTVTNVTALDTDTDTEVREPKGSCASGDALKPEHIFEKWNDLAERTGKPKVRDLTPERRALLKARIAQYPIEDFVTVFEAVERSAFLRGDTGWRGCTFNWVFKRGNFQKILEGNYND